MPFFPRAFLPPFNEGSLVLGVMFNPGTSLDEADRLGRTSERLIAEVPEVVQVGRRTGRAELDEHAEGVHAAASIPQKMIGWTARRAHMGLNLARNAGRINRRRPDRDCARGSAAPSRRYPPRQPSCPGDSA